MDHRISCDLEILNQERDNKMSSNYTLNTTKKTITLDKNLSEYTAEQKEEIQMYVTAGYVMRIKICKEG